jgi:hypothetical protein
MNKELNVYVPQPCTLSSNDRVVQLEAAMREQCECLDFDKHTKHYFADGVYLRSLFLPAGSLVTGKIHRTKHLTIICSGTVRVTTDDGMQEITGPAVFVSEPGIKKAAYAVTDVTIMNAHPTESTDLKEIEHQFIAPSFEALEQEKKKWLGMEQE